MRSLSLRYLLLVFIVMPIVEMWLLITVGREIGAWPTIGLVLLTAAIGLSLLRHQGFATLFRARQKMDAGELPAIEMIEAIILAVCGALLVTPGFVTDVVGFAGLVPSLRRAVVSRMVSKVNVVGGSAETIHHHKTPGSRQSASKSSDTETLEGEYWREDEEGGNR
jgi:UPF0716 protein FxsA